MVRRARTRTTLNGILTAAGNAALDVVVMSAHRSWLAGARVGRSLSPRHLALRLEALAQQLAADAEIASRR
jgi:hypothetical protein